MCCNSMMYCALLLLLLLLLLSLLLLQAALGVHHDRLSVLSYLSRLGFTVRRCDKGFMACSLLRSCLVLQAVLNTIFPCQNQCNLGLFHAILSS